MRVAVSNARSRQGLAQLRALIGAHHQPVALTRSPAPFTQADLAGVGMRAADNFDPASLSRALEGTDALFFQMPLLEHPDRLRQFAHNVAAAAGRAGLTRVILNSTMWSPDTRCGQPTYDLVREIEEIFEATDLPLTIFRPTVFMDNWITSYARPALIHDHLYRYPHKPQLRFSPISLDDLARFMVAALPRNDLIGQRFRVAGPQTLSPADVRSALSAAMGVEIAYQYVSPMDFAEDTFERFVKQTGADRAAYVAAFDNFYRFNNDAPEQPFLFDVAPVRAQIDVPLETFAQWAARQNWFDDDGEGIGSISG